MAGYTYNSYVSALQVLVVSQAPDAPFTTILPSCIDYAEQRIYRELNLLDTVTTDVSVNTASGTRNITIPDNFVVVNDLAIFVPAGTNRDTGTRKPLVSVSRSVLDVLWPGVLDAGEPSMFSMIDQWSMALGPVPDGVYNVEVVGTYRPTPLGPAQAETFISTRLPDLFLAASMVFMTGYQRNFGAQSNDPQMGQSWENQYQLLKGSADAEEARKHFWASAWTSQPAPPQANPPRG